MQMYSEIFGNAYLPASNTQVCYGWLLLDGSRISCAAFEHLRVAERLDLTERDVELLGWIKLTQGPSIPGTGTFFLKSYTLALACQEPTGEQENWLNEAGFFLVEYENSGIHKFAYKPE